MKITELKTFVVGNPPPHHGGRYFIIVKLTADNGISGIGEVYAASFGPHTIVKMIEDVAERHVIGADPSKITALYRAVYSRGYSMRPDPSVSGVLSGLETACWDLCGKALGKPIYALLGGKVRDRLRSYSYLYPPEGRGDDFYFDADASAEQAAQYVAEGFTAIKFDPVDPYNIYDPRTPTLEELDRTELFCRRLREAVGTKADLLLGTHGQFTAAGALRLARRVENYDLLWFEEPTPPEMAEEMAKVAQRTRIPIATGERLCSRFEFRRLLNQGSAAILQMAIGRVGGILEARAISGMAEGYYTQIAPHLYCGPVEGAANIQLGACIPNFLILESIRKWDGFHAELLKTPIQWEDGYVVVPDAPGLGIELDEEVAEAHPYTGDRLHLEVDEVPRPL